MARATFEELLEAGVHFGHLKRKWNPYMASYIFTEKKGIHIIDLNKTIAHLDQACAALKQIAKSGKKILFVATKKQAKDILEETIKPTRMPYVVERWSGGMLTNFGTIRKAIRKMSAIDKMEEDGTMKTLSKRERLQLSRTRAKLDKNYGTIADMTRVPAAVFVIDVLKEHIAVKEANKLNIPTFAMVDTNSDPRDIDFIIPSNDDATKSINTIMTKVSAAIMEGLEERKVSRDKAKASKEAAEAAAVAAKAAAKAKAAAAAEAKAKAAEAATAVAEEAPKGTEEK
ncbi:MAG: 30S ribosomal protein S2 [Crocinitomix sp.]|nr:30S ribosomal protein S2 [Crocinitomix sp.]